MYGKQIVGVWFPHRSSAVPFPSPCVSMGPAGLDMNENCRPPFCVQQLSQVRRGWHSARCLVFLSSGLPLATGRILLVRVAFYCWTCLFRRKPEAPCASSQELNRHRGSCPYARA